jgi:hypothetical protein
MTAPNLRTDLHIAQFPLTYPNVGGLLGKNTIVTDPSFQTQIVRMTDGSSAKGDFSSMQTADDPGAVIGNTNDTLWVFRNNKGLGFLFQFDTSVMQGTDLYQLNGSNSNYEVSGGYTFSRTNPAVLYNIAAKSTVVNALTFAPVAGVWTYQSTTEVCDFANILPGSFAVNWQSELTCSLDDSTFVMGFSEGVQNTGFNMCIYNRTNGYRMLNTQTLAVTGQWGDLGTATVENVPGGLPSFFLHATRQNPNPAYCQCGPGGAGAPDVQLIWETATLTLVSTGIGGHHGSGYLADYNGQAGGGQYQQIPYTHPQQHTDIVPQQAGPPGLPADQVPPQDYTGDQHSAFGLISETDESLLWVSNGTPSVFPFTSCWMGEVRGYDVTGAVSGAQGTVYRACHTFNSGKSPQYVIANAQLGPSQTGNFVAFASDWGGAGTVGPLGSTSGQPTGVIGGNARGDVFIVRINAAPIPVSGNVTGQFILPNGTPVANGTYQFSLNAAAAGTAVCVAPTLIAGQLDTAGNLDATLFFNDELNTFFGYNTFYQLTVKDVTGKQVWNNKYYLTGTAANLNLIAPLGNS